MHAARKSDKLKGVDLDCTRRKCFSPTHLARGPFMTLFSLFHPILRPFGSAFWVCLGGSLYIFEVIFEFGESDAFQLSLCHLERFANPGYPARADSEALGRAEDETLC